MNNILLDALLRQDLQSYYLELYEQGISYDDIMLKLSTEDFSKISLKAPIDKLKFKAMYHEQQLLLLHDEIQKANGNKIIETTRYRRESPILNEIDPRLSRIELITNYYFENNQ